MQAKPKFAVMTFMFKSWWADGRLSIEEIHRGIAAAGADGVEPFDRDFVQDPQLLPRFRRIMDDTGLAVPVVDVMSNLVYSDRKGRQEGLDALRRGLDICRALKSEIAHVAGHRLPPDVTPEDGRKMIADGLMEVHDEAAADDITLAIENFNPSPELVCSAGDCLQILQLTGNAVKFVFDTGNFFAVHEDANANFDRMADHICHCHFKDYALDPGTPAGYRGSDLGAGDAPNPAIARKLSDRGYDGWIALETRSRNEVDPVTAVEKELPLLQSWFDVSS